jgi:hypothetical protein
MRWLGLPAGMYLFDHSDTTTSNNSIRLLSLARLSWLNGNVSQYVHTYVNSMAWVMSDTWFCFGCPHWRKEKSSQNALTPKRFMLLLVRSCTRIKVTIGNFYCPWSIVVPSWSSMKRYWYKNPGSPLTYTPLLSRYVFYLLEYLRRCACK